MNNIHEVTIIGFNRTPSGLKLLTSPSLDIWVNSRAEYDNYSAKTGETCEFASRKVTTRSGNQKTVYDLIVKANDLSDEELDTIFNRTYEAAEEGTEEKPF
jgi:hypothetical protein